MTDRVPGAPGQYTMTVSAEEAQKLLTGEAVTITMKRDDRPLVEGTPYNKASVLPDDLAAQICPNVSDPTPADALRALLPKTGGAMSGPLNMANQQLTGLREPSSDSDAATLKTLKSYAPKSLWTNSATGSEFSGKTVAISGLSDYPMCVVELAGGISGTFARYVKTVVVTNSGKETVAELSGSTGELFRGMKKSGNSMVFSDCYAGLENTVTANSYLIPVAVYGIR